MKNLSLVIKLPKQNNSPSHIHPFFNLYPNGHSSLFYYHLINKDILIIHGQAKFSQFTHLQY